MQQPPQQIYCVDQYNTFKRFLFNICTYSFKYYQIWEMHDCHVFPEVRQVQIFKVFLPKTKITVKIQFSRKYVINEVHQGKLRDNQFRTNH